MGLSEMDKFGWLTFEVRYDKPVPNTCALALVQTPDCFELATRDVFVTEDPFYDKEIVSGELRSVDWTPVGSRAGGPGDADPPL